MIKGILLGALCYGVSRIVCHPKQIKPNMVITIIRLDEIGDFILWLDTAKEYRAVYPNRTIRLICNSLCAELARKTGYFDIVIGFCKQHGIKDSIRSIIRLGKSISTDILVNPTVHRTYLDEVLASCITATQRIGIRSAEWNVNQPMKSVALAFEKQYDMLIDIDAVQEMVLIQNASFIRALGRCDFLASASDITAYGVDFPYIHGDDYFIVFPGASNIKRAWDIEKYAGLSHKIVLQTGWKCCICGGSGEDYLGKQIKNTIGEENCIDLTGKTSILELIDVISHAKMYFGNDTCGVHIAAATQTPAIAVTPQYSKQEFLPYSIETGNPQHLPIAITSERMACAGCLLTRDWRMSNECRRAKKYRCIAAVSYERVEHSVNALIEELRHDK